MGRHENGRLGDKSRFPMRNAGRARDFHINDGFAVYNDELRLG